MKPFNEHLFTLKVQKLGDRMQRLLGEHLTRSGVEEARRTLHDVVVIDTAGRLGVDAEMMQQAFGVEAVVELLQHEIHFFHVELTRRSDKHRIGGFGQAASSGDQAMAGEPV